MKFYIRVFAILFSIFGFSESQANAMNIDVLSVQRHIFGGWGCCGNSAPGEYQRFEYDLASSNINTPLHFAYPVFPGLVLTEANAGEFSLETFASNAAADAWAYAESIYTFQPAYSTIHINSIFEGYVDGATNLDSWFRLTNLSTNEQLIYKNFHDDEIQITFPYQLQTTLLVQNGSDETFFVNPENIYQLEMFAGLGVGQTGGYMNLNVDMAAVPEPSSFILLGASLAGFGVSRKRKII